MLKIESDATLTQHQGEMRLINGAAAHVDAAFIDCQEGSLNQLNQLAQFMTVHPHVTPVLLASKPSPEFLIQALRNGVKEIIKSPDDEQEIASALARIRVQARQFSGKNAKVLSVLSCKGGAGATFIATNLAYALAAPGNLKILLIDVNLQFGDAALFISERKAIVGLADLAKDLTRMDLALLESSALNPLPNLTVLAASEDPSLSADVKPAHIEALLALARPHFDVVILDVGRSLDPVSIKALDLSDEIFPVLQLTLPFVRDAKRLTEIFRSLDYPEAKIRPILNRWERSEELDVDALEKAMGLKVHHVVPNHYKSVSSSINQGIPILRSSPGGIVSKSLEKLAASMNAKATQQAEKGWLDRIWKRG